jgi:TetR/AcrR family transcriptional regulator, repressor of fatR-cypB operon
MKDKNRRDDILKAALDVIAERGFHEAPMSLIADRAGVSSGTIYIYFKSKDTLINEVNRMLRENIMAVIRKNYPSEKDVKERFSYLCKTVLTYFIANPIHFQFLEQYVNSPYGKSLHREMIFAKSKDFDIFRSLIEEGIREKIIKNLPIFIHFTLAFGPLVMLARNHVLGLVKMTSAQIDHAIDAFWDAVKI